MLKRNLVLALATLWSAAAMSANESASKPVMTQQALTQEARQQTKAFGSHLKKTVKQGMMAGGPTEAIHLCNTQAPGIASEHSQGDWKVGRTSLKLRNPDNKPTAWEASVLADFNQRLAAGENPKKMEASKMENGTFHYMKAIPTGGLCLNCHGSKLAEPVKARLAELYPNDQATGYEAGQIRGAFTLTTSVEM